MKYLQYNNNWKVVVPAGAGSKSQPISSWSRNAIAIVPAEAREPEAGEVGELKIP